METTIAAAILKARKTSVAAGQKKYRTYFVTLGFLYGDYKEKTDALLVLADAEDCIVKE
jgi:hypothetical protein